MAPGWASSRASSLPQGSSVQHKTTVGASLLAMAMSQAQRISSCQGYTPSPTYEQTPYTISHSRYKALPVQPVIPALS
ncbi:hypothetical protein FHJ31_21130 [Pseudomonas sp. Fig-3]|nr:hypothetical protein FHJ31_21130 [Pseudomonas sp. Fig-3]